MQRGLLLVEEVTIFKLVGRRSHERHGADTGNQTPVVACHALAQGDTRPVVGDPAEPDPGLCRAYFSENWNLDSPIRELESHFREHRGVHLCKVVQPR